MARTRTAALWILVGITAAAWTGTGCGPSEISKRLDAYKPAVERRLDAEDEEFRRIHAMAQDQNDAVIAKRYRRHLEDVAGPFYAEFEKGVTELDPAHPGLAGIREALIAYAKYRREFVAAQLRHIAAKEANPEAMETGRAMADVLAKHKAYLEVVGDDVPDGRLSEVTGPFGGFLNRTYKRALDGSMEFDAAMEQLRSEVHPRLRRLRAGRFDDTPAGQAFREYAVAADDCATLLEKNLRAVMDLERATSEVEAALAGADAERKRIADGFRAADRDR
jgi:hypothetical protein